MSSREPLVWRKHFLEEWQQLVGELNPLEEWATLRLFDEQWRRGSIRAEHHLLKGFLESQFGDLPMSLFKKHIDLGKVLRIFPPLEDDPKKRRNPRLHELRLDSQERYALMVEGGRVGGRRSAAKRRSAAPSDLDSTREGDHAGRVEGGLEPKLGSRMLGEPGRAALASSSTEVDGEVDGDGA